jgi:NADH:ubiquinone oxidoreductase subunit 3 (subunit A)
MVSFAQVVTIAKYLTILINTEETDENRGFSTVFSFVFWRPHTMLNPWLYIGIFLIVVFILPGVPVLISALIAPRKPNPIKNATYECGVETVGETWVQFKVQYYVFALLFVIFDVESIFLFPWAVAYNQMNLFMALEGVLFILILTGGLAYIWKKGGLEWV